ncbi:hypothetical protein N7485_003639 [Penicillium canescens]|nr:hypothetical protein N7485_003639 [Penicillium canescens]
MHQDQNKDDTRESSAFDYGLVRVSPPPLSDPERLAKSCAPLVKLSALYRILEHEGSAFEERWLGNSSAQLCRILIGYFDYTSAIYGRKEKFQASRLLVTKWPDSAFIYLYEAQFTSELLEAIENPKNATARTNWPIITQKKIPFKPFGTFQQRLVAELLRQENRHCESAPDIKDGADLVVKRSAKRQHEEGDETRTVRRKVDMACGNRG